MVTAVDQIKLDAIFAKKQNISLGDIVLAVVSGYTNTTLNTGLTINPPDADGFVTFVEYPGFKFLCNLTLQMYSCTARQEAMIRGNVSCAHDGTLTAAAALGFGAGMGGGSGYSWMAPIKFAPPTDPNDPFGHWVATDEHFNADDGLWPLRFRAVDVNEAATILTASPPARPTSGGNLSGTGFVPQS